MNREATPEDLWVGFLLFGNSGEMLPGLQAFLVLPELSPKGWLWLCIFLPVLELWMLP